MTCLTLAHTRRSSAGSLASTFQKLLIQSTARVFMMSSYTAFTSALASGYSISFINATVSSIDAGPYRNRCGHCAGWAAGRRAVAGCSAAPPAAVSPAARHAVSQHRLRPRARHDGGGGGGAGTPLLRPPDTPAAGDP